MRRLVLAAALLVLACAQAQAQRRPLPPLPLDSPLLKLDGGKAKLADFRGKVVLVDFWATWCEPCRKSLPFYSELFKAYSGKGLEIVGVNVDEDAQLAHRFLEREPLPFLVVMEGPGGLAETLDLDKMPTAFLLDRDGVVRYRHEGFGPRTEEELRREVEDLLGNEKK